ncbi:hypothetical protein B296_00038546 [Ensete ventricosum]|uniref:Uncharacterized protein n=1 Tax=Ensete ventricosum TaxID=4639 RepID=A0A426X5H9_ENSVE|nr:hypothetical protein B296_00038546 [Ensete ventricosum]
MHPLRFPNSGIRAKAARRRGSWAWPRLAPLQGQQPSWGGHPQGQQLPAGTTGCGQPAGVVASRGDGAGRRGHRPLARWLPTGRGSRRLHMGSDGSTGTEGERGLGHLFIKR